MDIQTRKINFIQEFLKIQNEEVVERFEKIMDSELMNYPVRNQLPLSINEFYKRIDLSISDSENDKLIENNDLIDEISKWG